MTIQRTNPLHLPWSQWLAPKLNAPELLARAARRGALQHARIFLSSSTDPYTPEERRRGITRRCLEVMREHPPEALVVQTRSPLVLRDAALLAQIENAGVSFSVTTDCERVRRLLEPDSPRITRRIETLARLRGAGVRTQAAVAPLLPCEPRRLAGLLDPVVERIVVDDFFRGDGAGGRRSAGALALLREAGFADWAQPGYAAEAVAVFRGLLGEERVVESQAGFNDVGWLRGA